MPNHFTTLAQWLSWQETLHPATMDFDLSRLRQVYTKLNISTLATKTVIVGGTNGKGSTTILLETIYRQAGYQTATYTSPHITHYNERIRINRQPVQDQELINAFQKVEQARGEISLTYFEFGTLAAFVIFAQVKPDIAIIEVGLGGRLDATNILDADIAVITSIGLDHQGWLGDSLDDIAREKAGIMRPACPAICGQYQAPDSLQDVAIRLGASLLMIGRDFDIVHDDKTSTWAIRQERDFGPLQPSNLAGEHQYRNAACAVLVSQYLQQELPVTLAHINQALQTVTLPGRCERIAEQPDVMIDVAHNAEAVQALKQVLVQQPAVDYCHIVLGILDDKPVEAFFQYLSDIVDCWYLTQPDNPRALSTEQLEQRFLQYFGDKVPQYHILPSVVAALKTANNKASDADRIIITGSFYTVLEALQAVDSHG